MRSLNSLSAVRGDSMSRALLVIVGALLVTLLLAAYGIYRQYDEFQNERRQYNSQISQLKAEVSQYRSALRSVAPDLTAAQKQTLTKNVDAAILQSKINVNAACEDLKTKGANGLEIYKFRFWLSDAADALRQIRSVDYFLDHPTFSQKHNISTDPSTNFEQSYRGWGCLDSVSVRITFDDPSVQPAPIDFNQCKALQGQSCSEH
jgi:hypothetical protein